MVKVLKRVVVLTASVWLLSGCVLLLSGCASIEGLVRFEEEAQAPPAAPVAEEAPAPAAPPVAVDEVVEEPVPEVEEVSAEPGLVVEEEVVEELEVARFEEVPEEPRQAGTVGIASWYGKKFHGRPTASGEIYDMYALTAAHRTLPLGTIVRVTSLRTNKQVKVKVNDRGPFVKGRIIDLSFAAFNEIERVEKGTARVRVEAVGRDTGYERGFSVRDSGTGDYVVQVGAFTNKANAVRLKRGLSFKYPGAYMTEALIKGRTFHRVRAGRFGTREEAEDVAKRLGVEGYSSVIMRE